MGSCLQRFVCRHRWYGKRHNLLLAPVAERDQKLPYCPPHHWARHRHRNLPLRANLNSWVDPFEVKNSHGGDYNVSVSGAPFNDAYRYVDWLLTVPLLLIELILVMKLPKDETVDLSWKLGVAYAVM